MVVENYKRWQSSFGYWIKQKSQQKESRWIRIKTYVTIFIKFRITFEICEDLVKLSLKENYPEFDDLCQGYKTP